MDLYQKINGSIISGIYGDALGAPVELWSAEFILKRIGKITKLIKTHKNDFIGQYTDDTEMIRAIIKSINKMDSYVLTDMIDSFKKNYTPNRGYGESTENLLKNNIIPENNKQTNGGIMRLIPVILFSLNDSDYFFEKKIIEHLSLTGHTHEKSIKYSLMFGKFIKFLINNNDITVINIINYFKQNYSNDLTLMKIIDNYIDNNYEMEIIKSFDTYSIDVDITFFKVINSLLYNFDNPLKNITRVIEYGGDTDTSASLLGNIIGIIYGYEWIDKDELNKIENIDEIMYELEQFNNLIKITNEIIKQNNMIEDLR